MGTDINNDEMQGLYGSDLRRGWFERVAILEYYQQELKRTWGLK
jgi:hypothetical protein